MPYTRTWAQVNALLGSRDADEIDDASRETHVDLTERFGDILKDVTADPWELDVPQPGLITRYPWHSGYVKLTGPSTLPLLGPNYISPSSLGDTAKIWLPVPVAIGYRLKKVSFRWKRDSTGTATGEVFRTMSNGTSITGEGSTVIPPATPDNTWVDTPIPLTVAIQAGETIFAIVTLTIPTNTALRGYFMDMEVTTEFIET